MREAFVDRDPSECSDERDERDERLANGSLRGWYDKGIRLTGTPVAERVAPPTSAGVALLASAVNSLRGSKTTSAAEYVDAAIGSAANGLGAIAGVAAATNVAGAVLKGAAVATGAAIIGPTFKVISAAGLAKAAVASANTTAVKEDGLLYVQASYLLARDALQINSATFKGVVTPTGGRPPPPSSSTGGRLGAKPPLKRAPRLNEGARGPTFHPGEALASLRPREAMEQLLADAIAYPDRSFGLSLMKPSVAPAADPPDPPRLARVLARISPARQRVCAAILLLVCAIAASPAASTATPAVLRRARSLALLPVAGVKLVAGLVLVRPHAYAV